MYFSLCHQVKSILSDYDKTWFIAGGWAIDLFLGRETRSHGDIEIAIFRIDQFSLKSYLEDWEIKKVIDGTFHEWKNEQLVHPIYELHASHKHSNMKMEILLNENYQSDWIFRRDSRIKLHEKSIFNISEDGIPYLKPEIILLYKAN